MSLTVATLYEEHMMIADLEGVSRSVLVCIKCGAFSEAFDARETPHAWDGWTVAADPKCPNCNGVAKAIQDKSIKVSA